MHTVYKTLFDNGLCRKGLPHHSMQMIAVQSAIMLNTPPQTEHQVRWPVEIMSLCIAKCAT